MAQLKQQATPLVRRLLATVRRRPRLGAAVLCLVVLCGIAVGMGVSAAGGMASSGVLIERADSDGGGDRSAVEDEDHAEDDDAQPSRDAEGAGSSSGKGDASPAGSGRVVVDVAGAVVQPGVVVLPASARVRDAIDAAGGLAPDADASAVNRAAPLADGQQVYIPRVGEAPGAVGAAAGAAAGSSAAVGSGQPAGATGSGAPVNINTADEAALDGLPGVGPSTAAAIIEDRQANGPFSAPEDLMRVSGIGDKKFERLKSLICV